MTTGTFEGVLYRSTRGGAVAGVLRILRSVSPGLDLFNRRTPIFTHYVLCDFASERAFLATNYAGLAIVLKLDRPWSLTGCGCL